MYSHVYACVCSILLSDLKMFKDAYVLLLVAWFGVGCIRCTHVHACPCMSGQVYKCLCLF